MRIIQILGVAFYLAVGATWAGAQVLSATTTSSPTWSVTATATGTPTATSTGSPVNTSTATKTISGTPNTPTQTPTPTVTATATETISGTPNTPTQTPTPTISMTPTVTATVTFTATVTSTTTSTSTPGIASFQVEPKTLSGSVTLRWELTADMLHLQVKVFTSSFRMLRSFPMDIKKTPELFKTGVHSLPWDGLDDRGYHLVSGRYYLFLSANKGKLKFTAEDQVNQP